MRGLQQSLTLLRREGAQAEAALLDGELTPDDMQLLTDAYENGYAVHADSDRGAVEMIVTGITRRDEPGGRCSTAFVLELAGDPPPELEEAAEGQVAGG
ncbi:hypothetical protein SAMN04488058_10770 [Deinococcus reticulitermitis]|uniref:Uncharacterized protein n=1 Tax=Deinococcus reticulitermitis TaxID=856736 RepID=A0A1H6YF86_9DEIO|nr:hypothetical protein [Deinococcus reticulitermitis]SEJ39136.1 hypothetical protein SAMN04488058_10770 [Deinococcus reticulitermitis]